MDAMRQASTLDKFKKTKKNKRKELASYFSPHLEKIPDAYFYPQPGQTIGTLFADNPGAVARLLLESYDGDQFKVQKAARLARRVMEMLEFELENPKTDCFVDAAGSGQHPHVLKMLAKGQDIDGCHSVTGYTALHAACDFGYIKIVKSLVEAGADIHCTRKSDLSTPLHCAAENGHADIVRYLVMDANIDKLRKNKYGMLACDYARDNNHDLIVDMLREPPKQIVNVCERGIGTSTSTSIQWDVPDDNGVLMEHYEISILPLSGVEVELYPERIGKVKKICIDAQQFGTNPFRLKQIRLREQQHQDRLKDEERQRRIEEYGDYSSSEDEMEGKHDNNMEEKDSKENAHAFYVFKDCLVPSTEYSVIIRSNNVAGWSEPSEAFTFTTLPDVPTTPSQPMLAKTGATCISIDVTWTAPFSNNGRVIQVYEFQLAKVLDEHDSEYTWETISDSIKGSTIKLLNGKSGNVREEDQYSTLVFTADNLYYNSPYRVRIRAKNSVGWGEFGKVSNIIRTRPPATATEIHSKQFELDWSQSVDSKMHEKGILRWEIQRTIPPAPIFDEDEDDSEEQESGQQNEEDEEDEEAVRASPQSSYDWREVEWITVSNKVPGDIRHLRIRNLQPATMYFTRVRPIFSDKKLLSPPWGECPVSIGILTKFSCPEEPSPPVILSEDCYEGDSASLTHASVRITWKAPPDNGSAVSHYSIRFTRQTLGTWQVAAPGEFRRTFKSRKWSSRVISGLQPGTAYKFCIRAKNQVGWSTYSAPSVVVHTRPSCPPAAPHVISNTDSFMTVGWEMGDSASIEANNLQSLMYQVQFRPILKEDTSVELPWRPVQPKDTCSENQITAHDLSPVTYYMFRVRARTGAQDAWTNFGEAGGPFKTNRRF
mmetsp:Transcript_36504/g.58820  ORF Transcript_36504/g.58820 Transcript_36504/m.58820 type:complete len:883 (-) Transcript_36504:1849-4497(-)